MMTMKLIPYQMQEYRATIAMERFLDEYVDIETFGSICAACDNFGNKWSCPPYDFDPLQYLGGFKSMDVIVTKVLLQADAVLHVSKDELIEYKKDTFLLVKIVAEEQLLSLEKATPGSVAMLPGACMRCPSGCQRALGRPCVSPATLRHTLEAYGADLGRLAKDLFSLEFCWTTVDELPEYYLLVGALLLP